MMTVRVVSMTDVDKLIDGLKVRIEDRGNE